MSDERFLVVEGLKRSEVFDDYYLEATMLDAVGVFCLFGLMFFFVWIPRLDLATLHFIVFFVPTWLIFSHRDKKELALRRRLSDLEKPYLTQVKIGEQFGPYRFKGFLGQNKSVPGKPHWVTTTITYHTPIIEFNGEDFYVSTKGFTDLGGGAFLIKKKHVQKEEITIFRRSAPRVVP